MRALVLALSFLAATPALAETVTARADTVGCTYHDVLWDKTGYDKAGKPTPEMLALDICTGIATGRKLELFENQAYAPGGLKIVRIDKKLYFVRVRDVATDRQLKLEAARKAKAKAKAKAAKANAAKAASLKKTITNKAGQKKSSSRKLAGKEGAPKKNN